MNKASYPLKLPVSLKAAAQRLAEQDGVSLNQWISTTIALRVGLMDATQSFFQERAAGTGEGALRQLLDRVPVGATEAGDELPGPVSSGAGVKAARR